mgnify:CR=1 FL=1
MARKARARRFGPTNFSAIETHQDEIQLPAGQSAYTEVCHNDTANIVQVFDVDVAFDPLPEAAASYIYVGIAYLPQGVTGVIQKVPPMFQPQQYLLRLTSASSTDVIHCRSRIVLYPGDRIVACGWNPATTGKAEVHFVGISRVLTM